MGLRSHRPVRVPMMTPVHRQKCLQWAREHRNWTLEQWKKGAWSDESRFLLDHVDGHVHERHLPGEVMAQGCTVERRQAGGGSVMLWAMFCWKTLGLPIHVDVNLTRVTNLTIVAEQVYPFMAMVFPDGSGPFQQENAPCHTAHIVREWFEEHDEVFTVLPWPPNPPDLNPIEILWDVLDRQVRSTAVPPRNLQDLKDLLLMFWCQIPKDTFRGLVESMPRRVGDVLAAHGGLFIICSCSLKVFQTVDRLQPPPVPLLIYIYIHTYIYTY
uniref:Tc1-like transposase DDE domain-containing protein n=1 Tax=Eptatretus burgeri TaxID=7764 RepID=A0A8C4NKQ7_EPTBU